MSEFHRFPLLARQLGYSVFEAQLEKTRLRYELVVAGYVLMPEHVHLLVSEPKIQLACDCVAGFEAANFEIAEAGG